MNATVNAEVTIRTRRIWPVRLLSAFLARLPWPSEDRRYGWALWFLRFVVIEMKRGDRWERLPLYEADIVEAATSKAW